jgi:histidine triad (HIT) family protein
MPASRPDAPCPFCEIVDGTAEGRTEAHVVFEDEIAVAFLDRSPLFHGHTLVVPRRHVVTFADLPAELAGPFWRRVQHISRELPVVVGAEGTFVANNNIVSQSVAHLHVHVVPRRRGDGLRGFFWPRTKYSDGEAAVLAARLRDRFGGFTD